MRDLLRPLWMPGGLLLSPRPRPAAWFQRAFWRRGSGWVASSNREADDGAVKGLIDARWVQLPSCSSFSVETAS